MTGLLFRNIAREKMMAILVDMPFICEIILFSFKPSVGDQFKL